jgi:hypothetical protein
VRAVRAVHHLIVSDHRLANLAQQRAVIGRHHEDQPILRPDWRIYSETMTAADIDWIPEGTRFGVDDMAFFHGKGERDLDDVLGEIDLIVTGPHATAAFPGEMRPFVDGSLTTRLQYDFSDVTTAPVAQRWAAIDPKVLYIEDPHPRAVRDANRARPADLLATIREAFDRLAAEPDARPSLAGVDAVRPVTFGYLPVLRRPESDAEWNQLGAALTGAGANGVDAYERVRDDVIERVIEAKLRRLIEIEPASSTMADWNSATSLNVLSIHDTMNHTARPDGAICLERPVADRLPQLVALSNRGDARGELTASGKGALRDGISVPSMEPALLRSIGAAYADAFDMHGPDDVGYNRPYLGGYETQSVAPRLQQLAPYAMVRATGTPPRSLRLGAWQNEFLREFLLGEESTSVMMTPGSEWVGVPEERVEWLADRLKVAHDLVRAWGTSLDRRL